MTRRLQAFAVALICFGNGLSSAQAVSYHIRVDGGDAGQCLGTRDAPYPGTGSGQDCAWAHPFWALDAAGNWRMQGGDELVIHPGSYALGYGAPNTGWCTPEAAFDCTLPPLPSGPAADQPTRLVGAGWGLGCPLRPELWGRQRAAHLLDLRSTSNAVVACLELTDHSGCIEFHADPATACRRDSYPYGDWAADGLVAADSTNVLLQDLDIHGLAAAGVRAGRLRDWRVDNLRIAANGWVGWDGDIDGDDSNQGRLVFTGWTVEWNGCAESYPELGHAKCWAQSAGGYGDGVGTGATGGYWIIEDAVFRYNTSDGLDLLYVREPGSRIEVRRTRAYANAGDQIKINGDAVLANNLVVSECGFFEGKPFTYDVDACRAGGSALALTLRQGAKVSVVNSTVAGEGDCLVIADCDDGACDGSEQILLQNNLFRGYPEFLASGDDACYLWLDRSGLYQVRADYNLIDGAKLDNQYLGAQDILADPLLVDASLGTFDGRLQASSPAVASGLAVGALDGLIPDHDLELNRRPAGTGADRGALEQGAAATPDVKVNGEDGAVTLDEADSISVTVSLDPAGNIGREADWWLLASTPFGWHVYRYPSGWQRVRVTDLAPGYRGGLVALDSMEVLNRSDLLPGRYRLYFGIDLASSAFPDLERGNFDTVTVDVVD
jgi:hypothetical protein